MIQGKTSGSPNIVVGVSDDGGGPKKGPNRAGLEPISVTELNTAKLEMPLDDLVLTRLANLYLEQQLMRLAL